MEFLSMLPEFAQIGLSLLGSLVLLATIIVRLTPSPKDDELVGKVESWFEKLTLWMPTVGVNPKTAKLKEALEVAKGLKKPASKDLQEK